MVRPRHLHSIKTHWYFLQFFHNPLSLHLFPFSSCFSHSCLPFYLFCPVCVSLSCHKSNLLGAPEGLLPTASLCEPSGFFLICSVPHYIVIDLIVRHEFYYLSSSTIILNSIVGELDTQLWITLHFSPEGPPCWRALADSG